MDPYADDAAVRATEAAAKAADRIRGSLGVRCSSTCARAIATRSSTASSPGFFVADVLVDGTLNEDGVAPFLRKVEMLSGLRKLQRFMPALIADNFTPEALRLCRSNAMSGLPAKSRLNSLGVLGCLPQRHMSIGRRGGIHGPPEHRGALTHSSGWPHRLAIKPMRWPTTTQHKNQLLN